MTKTTLAKTKKKYGYYYRRYYYKRYKTVSNYFNVILNVPMIGIYTYNQDNPRFGMRGDGLDLNTNYSVAVLIQTSPMWQTYQNIFSMFKLRGVAVTAQAVGENIRFTGPMTFKLGYIKQGQGYDWRLVSEANHQLTLPFTGKSRFYVPMISSGVGWIKTANVITDQPGQFMMAKWPNDFDGISLAWNIEFKFYITFKLTIY